MTIKKNEKSPLKSLATSLESQSERKLEKIKINQTSVNRKSEKEEVFRIYKSVLENHYLLECDNVEKIKRLHEKALNDVKYSKPTYHRFEKYCPNFLKINHQHKESQVNGYFEQYNYFPWNIESNSIVKGLQRYIDLFFEIANLYSMEMKGEKYGEMTGLSTDKLFNDKYFLRICYQYFPKYKGYLSIHRDPTGDHQLSAPIVSLSTKKNFGLYYILKDKKVNIQSHMSYGDAVYMDQSRLHAIEHDLFTENGTEHFLIVVHRYHSNSNFLKSSTKE